MRRPTLEEVQHYCLSRRNGIDPQAFVDYYDSVGWLIGKKPMKDWQAAVRTWERKRREDQGQKAQSGLSLLANMDDRSWAQD